MDHFLGSKNHNLECFYPLFCRETRNTINKCISVMRENDQNWPFSLKMTFRTPFSGSKKHISEPNFIAIFIPSNPFTPYFDGQQKNPQTNVRKAFFKFVKMQKILFSTKKLNFRTIFTDQKNILPDAFSS